MILYGKHVLFPLDSESAVEKYILYWTLDVCDGEAKHRKTPSRLIQEAETQVNIVCQKFFCEDQWYKQV